MDDLAPSAVTPASKWEKTPSQDERRGRRHHPRQGTPPEDDPAEPIEEAEPHHLDELA